MSKQEAGKAGGKARAEVLSAEEKSAIARKAADARWGKDIPMASHDGILNIAGHEMAAAVLTNGMRLLSQGTFLRALGRSRTPKGGTGGLSTVDGLPFFLQADALQPFISEELMISTTPILFRITSGQRTVGYDAKLLPLVCEVYLKFRDDSLARTATVPRQYQHIIQHCDTLMRGLAQVGIIALVDEATGYQEARDRMALQAILDKFLRKEFAAWAKRFPDEFYQQIFRLRGWEWKGMKVNRPQVVALYTNDLVWERLMPGILDQLRARNPKDEKGNRKGKYHQLLTDDVGHPALAQHLFGVITLMRTENNWNDFKKRIDVALPRLGSNLKFSFMAE